MTGRRTAINPDVAAALGHANQKEVDRRRTPAQRQKAQSDRRRNRVTYDLPPRIEEMVERIARTEKVSKSGAAALLLAHAIHDYNTKDMTFFDLKTPSRSPLHQYVVSDENAQSVALGENSLEASE